MLTNDHAARLATEHDARTLAAALVARLRADGHESVASAVEMALSSYIGAAIDGTPPNPHRGGADSDFISVTPPNPHRSTAGAAGTAPADTDLIIGGPINPHRGGANAAGTAPADVDMIDGNPPNPHRAT